MSEPCRHERAASEAAMGDALTSLAASDAAMEMATAELLAKDATIERVKALLGDTAGPLWSVRGVRESDLRAALEATS